MNCPIIFYMEDGKIIDQGSYRELLQRNEKFREMAKEKQQGTMNNEQRTTNNEQQTKNNKQRTKNNEQQTTNNKQRTPVK
jgi:ABC-type uncharacterized transport system ATPase subunit